MTGTHIGLTIALLPNGPPKRSGLVGVHKATLVDKLILLAKPGSWNSLVRNPPLPPSLSTRNISLTFVLNDSSSETSLSRSSSSA